MKKSLFLCAILRGAFLTLAFGAAIAAPLVITGCGGSPLTAHAATLAEDFKASASGFDAARTDAAKELAADTEATLNKLAGTSPDLEDATASWEAALAEFKPKIDDMEKGLESATTEAEKYFAEMNRIAATIENAARKGDEIKKNNETEQKWLETHTEAAQLIAQLKSIQAEGTDMHKSMLLELLRGNIRKNIESIKSISAEAQTILSKLEQIKTKANELAKS